MNKKEKILRNKKEIKARNLRKSVLVKIISGSKKGSLAKIQTINSRGMLNLEQLLGLTSKKTAYRLNIHHSNVIKALKQ